MKARLHGDALFCQFGHAHFSTRVPIARLMVGETHNSGQDAKSSREHTHTHRSVAMEPIGSDK